MSEIIAVANQKGGVGKTTTVINLSASLCHLQKKILIVDLDPQGNTTLGLGIDRKELNKCIYNVILDEIPISEVLINKDIEGLHLIPATTSLAGAEIELVGLEGRERKLKKALQCLQNNYDYIFIDCPPSLGLLTLNALCAAQKILIPIQCEFYAMEAITRLLEIIKQVRKSINPDLGLKGVILTMYDSRTNLSRQVAEEVRYHFPNFVYETVIPRSVRLSEAPSFGKPVMFYDKHSRGAVSYQELAKEFLEKSHLV